MRWLKRLGLGLLVVVLVLAALWTWSKLRGATPAQRVALELLEAPNAFEGRNAFDAIWVLPYDVPDAEIASVADADMQAFAEAAREPDGPLVFTSAARRYPDLKPVRGPVEPCSTGGSGCLAKVSSAFDDYAALVQANARLIERVEALSAYGHHATRIPGDHRAPIQPWTLLAWPVTAHAVQFVRGERAEALEATCRDLTTLRRIGANSDTLIVQTYGTALATNGYGALLASMLAEIPRDMPLPAHCERALESPVAEEASICPAMRGELAWSTGFVRSARHTYASDPWAWLVFQPDSFRALIAEQMAAPCLVGADTLQRDALVVAAASPRPAWQRIECVANSLGCVLADMGDGYVRYANRALDHRARLQLLATLAWLREQPDTGTLAERIARRPGDLRSPARDITVTADGRSLEIAQYDTGYDMSRDATWSLPLPPYLVESTTTSD